MSGRYSNFIKAFGPGILFASTCIGVSHLVQSTRAGAEYGFLLLPAVIVANIVKFPFFEFASRYTSATGKSIIDGYSIRGKWILYLYFIITIPSMFIVTAAVTFVTAGLLGNLLRFGLGTDTWAMILLIVCIIILAIGKYKFLDNLLKVVGLALVLSVVVAFISAVTHGSADQVDGFVPKNIWEPAGIAFLIALMGWMPTAVDISTWPSLWAEAKAKQTGYRPSIHETLLDFNIGYWLSAVLAVMFLSLGAFIIYGTGTELSNSSISFADQIITMFTTAIGDWSYWVIAVAAFSTMFSTTITVIDGYSRAVTRTTKLILNSNNESESKRAYVIWTVVVASVAYLVITQFVNKLTSLVDLATILSFIIGPLAGYLNYKVIYGAEVPVKYHPPKYMRILAIIGLIFLTVFTLFYLTTIFFPGLINF